VPAAAYADDGATGKRRPLTSHAGKAVNMQGARQLFEP